MAPATVTRLPLNQIATQQKDAIIFDASSIPSITNDSAFLIFYLSKEDEFNGYGTVIQLDPQTKQAAIYADLNPEYTYLFYVNEQNQLQTLLWCIEVATQTNDGLFIAHAKSYGRGISAEDLKLFKQVELPENQPQSQHSLAESYAPTPQPVSSPTPAAAATTVNSTPSPVAPSPAPAPPTVQPTNPPNPTPTVAPTPPEAISNVPAQPAPGITPPATQPAVPAASTAPQVAPAPVTPSPAPINNPTLSQPAPSVAANPQPQPIAPLNLTQPTPVSTSIAPNGPIQSSTPPTQPLNFTEDLSGTVETELGNELNLPPLPVQSVPPTPPVNPAPAQPSATPADILQPIMPPASIPSPTPAPVASAPSAATPKQPVGRPPKPLLQDQLWSVSPEDFIWVKNMSRQPIAEFKEMLHQKAVQQMRINKPGLMEDWQFTGLFEQAFAALCTTYELIPALRHDILKALLNGRVVENLRKSQGNPPLSSAATL